MPSINQLRLPPIKDEDLFEEFCLELWSRIWNDPGAQRNGRRGQTQCGVDVFGIPEGSEDYEGVQAKAYATPLTEAQIQHEVDDAKKFVPPLKRLIIATTAPRDTNSQEFVRRINLKHRKAKLFTVSILGWADIIRLLKYNDLITKYFSISTDAAAVKEIVEESNRLVISAVEQQNVRIDTLSALHSQEKYHDDLNLVRDRLNSGRPQEALSLVQDFRSRCWDNAEQKVRYRIMHYTATAHFAMGHTEDGARGFISALNYNPEDDVASSFAALGYSLLGDDAKANELAEQALALNKANVRALAIVIHVRGQKATFDDVLDSIDPILKGLTDVANALSRLAHQKGLMTEAEEWVRKSIQSDTQNWAEPRGWLGILLLEQATESFISPQLFQLTPVRKILLLDAEQAFTNAIAGGGSADAIRGKAQWTCNRGHVRQLLGRPDEALRDLEDAVVLAPDKSLLQYRLAVFLQGSGEKVRALSILKKLVMQDPEAFDYQLTLASALAVGDELAEAKSTLQQILERQPPIEIEQRARQYLVQIAQQEGDLDAARRLSDKMLENFPESVAALVEAARIELQSGNRERALNLLVHACQSAQQSKLHRDIHLVAATWEAAGMFVEAAEQYETIADIEADSHFTRRLINCQYRAGNLGRALSVAQQIFASFGPRAPYSEIASAVYGEIGDLSSARRITTEYLAINPADFSMQLRLVVISQRTGDTVGVERFLSMPVDEAALDLDDAILVVALRQFGGRTNEALKLAWATRRRFFNESRAHTSYIALFTEDRHSNLEGLLRHDTVEEGTAVRVRDQIGNEQWYLIDGNADPARLPDELLPSHPLAVRLLGRNVGDTVTVVESPYSPTTGVIEEIQSKYVRALQESMTSHEQQFPGQSTVWMVGPRLNDSGELEPNLDPLLEMLDKRSQSISSAEKLYREGKLTVGAFANLTGMEPLAGWDHLRRGKQEGVRCGNGNLAQMQTAQAQIASGAMLIADAISLFTVYNLKCRDKLLVAKPRFGIAQSTLEVVERLVEDRKAHETGGVTSVGKEDGQYSWHEQTPEQVREAVAYLSGFLVWTQAKCEILPVNEVLVKGRSCREKFNGTMDMSFVDTMLLAVESGRVLYSDDERLRSLANHELGIIGIWTQPFLGWASATGAISETECARELVELISSGYYLINMNYKVVLEAARQSKWAPVGPVVMVADLLSARHCDETSASAIVAETSYELWKQPLMDHQRSALLDCLLSGYVSGRNVEPAVNRLLGQVRRRFDLLPIHGSQVMACIATWVQAHVI